MANEIKKEEIMSDEQLEQVAGGTIRDSSMDLKFMQACGLLRQDDTAGLDTMTRAWGMEGITVVMHQDGVNANEYIRNGKVISRYEAMKFVAHKHGIDALNLNQFM